MKKSLLSILFTLGIFVTAIAQTTVKTSEVNFEDYGVCVEKATVKSTWPYSKHGLTQYYKGDVLVAKVNYTDGLINGDYIYYFNKDCKGKVREIHVYKNNKVQKETKYVCDEANGSSKKTEELTYDFKPDYNQKIYYYNLSELSKNSYSIGYELDYTNTAYNTMAEYAKKYNISDYLDIEKCICLIEQKLGGSKSVVYYYVGGKVATGSLLLYKSGSVAIRINGSEVKVYNKSGKMIGWEINGRTNLYDNGQVIKSGDTTFYKNGKIMSIETYLSTYLSFYENGIKQRHGDTIFYQSGKIESIGYGISFYENGIKKKSGDTTFYQNGKIATIGKNIVYYENGNLKTDGVNKYFENGKPEYIKDEVFERTYDFSGHLLTEKNLETGQYLEFYYNGRPKVKAYYNKDGKLDGIWAEYDESGNLLVVYNYEAGTKYDVSFDDVYSDFRNFFGIMKTSEFITLGDKPVEYYQPHEKTALLYNKGNKLFKNYKEKLTNEHSSKIVYDAMMAFNSLKEYTKDNSEIMQQELKKAKTPDDIAGFLSYYYSIKSQASSVNSKFADMLGKYENEFPAITKMDIKPLNAEVKTYNKAYYCEGKFNQGKSLLSKLDTLLSNFPLLQKQKQEIGQKQADFIAKFKGNKANKNLFGKGTVLLDFYSDRYEKEGNSTRKLSIGNNDLLPILIKLLSFSNGDNLDINAKLKNAKTNEQIEAILNFR